VEVIVRLAGKAVATIFETGLVVLDWAVGQVFNTDSEGAASNGTETTLP